MAGGKFKQKGGRKFYIKWWNGGGAEIGANWRVEWQNGGRKGGWKLGQNGGAKWCGNLGQNGGWKIGKMAGGKFRRAKWRMENWGKMARGKLDGNFRQNGGWKIGAKWR